MSPVGPKRTWRDVCYESVMRLQADMDQEPPVVDLAGDHHHVACRPTRGRTRYDRRVMTCLHPRGGKIPRKACLVRRGLDHFRKEGAKLVPPPTADDPYEDEAYRLWAIKQRSK